jgi:putative alpha-1,2-mannosidase
MVPFDPGGLARKLGGRRAASARLARFLRILNSPDAGNSDHALLGNEPNLNTPWLFDWFGKPYLTQATMRNALRGLYGARPGGYPGNDDLGQMSAWYVFGALGFYPAVPGTDVLALGSPLFPRTTVRLRGGRLTIAAPRAARDAPYVQRLRLNGRSWNRPWLRLADVARGGRLAFDLAKEPNRRWGSRRSAAPPSFAPGSRGACRRPR